MRFKALIIGKPGDLRDQLKEVVASSSFFDKVSVERSLNESLERKDFPTSKVELILVADEFDTSDVGSFVFRTKVSLLGDGAYFVRYAMVSKPPPASLAEAKECGFSEVLTPPFSVVQFEEIVKKLKAPKQPEDASAKPPKNKSSSYTGASERLRKKFAEKTSE